MAKNRKTAKRAEKPKSGGKLSERALGPAADAFGKKIAPIGDDAGEVAVRAGKLLISAVSGAVYGLEVVGEWLRGAIARRLKNVSAEKLVQPSARIAVPAVQALVYSMDDDLIRELFANLLASDMNSETKSSAHPAFVELIKQMRSEDARVFLRLMESPEYKYEVHLRGGNKLHFGDIEFSFEMENMDRHNIAYSLDNLQRLGLVELDMNRGPVGERFDEKRIAAASRYEDMVRAFSERPEGVGQMGMSGPFSTDVKLAGIYATGLGVEFWKACMNERGGAVIPTSVKPA